MYKINQDDFEKRCKKHYKNNEKAINELLAHMDLSDVNADHFDFTMCEKFKQDISKWKVDEI